MLSTALLLASFSFLILFGTFNGTADDQRPLCNWAQNFTDFAKLLKNPDQQEAIMQIISQWEGNFAAHGIGVNFQSGLTYAYVDIYLDSGLARPKVQTRKMSTLYSESLHLAILAQALNGSQYAQAFLTASRRNESSSTIELFVLEQLERKMTAYEEYRTVVPGMCGLPCNDMAHTTDGLQFRCFEGQTWLYVSPFGHFGWALIAAGQALRNYAGEDQTLQSLASQYFGLLMAAFKPNTGELQAMVEFHPQSTECKADSFVPNAGVLGEEDWETVVWFAYFFSNWTNYGGSERREALLASSRRYLTPAELLTTSNVRITVQQGRYYAAWERIVFLFVPYFDVPITERLFRNSERARLQFSAQNRYPGLFTSVECATEPNNYTWQYYEALGIEELAAHPVQFYEIVAPMAAFPALLHPATRSHGLMWYLAMIQGAKMQGPLGATSAFHSVDVISPMMTWIAKLPPIIAMGGGVGGLTSQYLQQSNRSQELKAVFEREYGQVFTELNGEQLAFALPTSAVDSAGPRFTTCSNVRFSGNITPKNPSEGSRIWPVIAIGGSVTITVILSITAIYCCYRTRRHKAMRNIIFTSRYWEQTLDKHPSNRKNELEQWLISPPDLIISAEQLGTGAFACVYHAVLLKLPTIAVVNGSHYERAKTASMNVAVKMPLKMANKARREEFMNEIIFMKDLGHHSHLLNMLGCVCDMPDNLALVIELCEHGDLLHVLRSNRSRLTQKIDQEAVNTDGSGLQLDLKCLLPIAWQICDAMVYLNSRNVIHRDIAARNILLTGNITAKIADFGLCRTGQQMGYISRGGLLPFRWLALESLRNMEFSTKTDVWSFGVLLFELYSLGESPYSTIQQVDIQQHLEKGHRLRQPELAANEIYKIMTSCWYEKPAERPSFDQLLNTIAELIDRNTEQYGYLNATIANEYGVTNPTSEVQSRAIETVITETPHRNVS